MLDNKKTSECGLVNESMIKLELLAISEILDKQFFIRDYQRGYRWTEQQVKQLLDDIDSFIPMQLSNDPSKKTFYCLQPIVLKNLTQDFKDKKGLEGDWYEVIDGQQRLTTFYLILQYINEFWTGLQKKKIFKINYETREESVDFLKNVRISGDFITVDINKENIDFFHISTAYQVIRTWEIEYSRNHDNKDFDEAEFQSKFLRHSKIIWYEVEQEEDSIELFERLNLGKIPLTNSELTKALFLSGDSFKELSKEEKRIKHFEIASLWDEIEHKLNEPNKIFWSFITNKERDSFDTKIDLILDFIAEKKESEPDPLYTFLTFLAKSKKTSSASNSSPLSEIWKEIEQFYHTLIEWSNNRDLYHLVGYLVSSKEFSKHDGVEGYRKESLYDLMKLSMESTKKDFISYLNARIRNSVNFEPSELRYDEHKDRLYNLLLLFNVETYRTSDSIDDFYPFKQHKSNQWSLEHVQPQNPEGLSQTKQKQWIRWLNFHLPVLKDLEKRPRFQNKKDEIMKLISNIEVCCDGYSDEEAHPTSDERLTWDYFMTLFIQTTKLLTDDSAPDDDTLVHGLGNMTLLSISENAALNNTMFEVKRRKIIEMDKGGKYIPICTRRLFLGYYTKPEEIFIWSYKEQEAYSQMIVEGLKDYLPDESKRTSGDSI